jgi:hypothetical protein
LLDYPFIGATMQGDGRGARAVDLVQVPLQEAHVVGRSRIEGASDARRTPALTEASVAMTMIPDDHDS